MTVLKGINRRLSLAEIADEGCVLVPFGFTINNTTHPDGVEGDWVTGVTRDEAGEFSVALKNIPAICFFAHADISVVADDTDLYARCDWSTVTTNGILKVRFQDDTTQTDPTNDTFAGGFLIVKKTSRRRNGRG